MREFKDNWRMPEIEDNKTTRWGWRVRGVKYFHLGKYTDIGFGCYIRADSGAEVTIEDFVQIGGGVKIYGVNTIDETQGPVTIEKGACVGANSVILPDTRIGKGAKIGALSLVNGVVPEKQTWAGTPARWVK